MQNSSGYVNFDTAAQNNLPLRIFQNTTWVGIAIYVAGSKLGAISLLSTTPVVFAKYNLRLIATPASGSSGTAADPNATGPDIGIVGSLA